MSDIKESDFLSLLTSKRKIPADVLFKFGGREDTLGAHKLVLAQVSDVYLKKFYGPLSENTKVGDESADGIEHVTEGKYSYEAFDIFLQHVYGNKEIINDCSSFEILLELLEMSKLHLLESLTVAIEDRIDGLNVTMENILSVLNLYNHYKALDGFKAVTEALGVKIIAVFSKLSMKEQYKFQKLHRDDNPDLVIVLVDLMCDEDGFAGQVDAQLCNFCHVPQRQCEHAGFVIGARVVRGPDWDYDDCEDDIGLSGSIVEDVDWKGWIGVKWDHSDLLQSASRRMGQYSGRATYRASQHRVGRYRMGAYGKYDLKLI